LLLNDESGIKKPRVSFLNNLDHLAGRNDVRMDASNSSQYRRATHEEKCTLFIDGLCEGVTPNDLAPVFAPYGHIEEWKIGNGKTYGTLRFRTRDAASMALEQLHNSIAAGSQLQLEWYLPRERGTLPPQSIAYTSQQDLDNYHLLQREPNNFNDMMRLWKPHIVEKQSTNIDASTTSKSSYVTMGGKGILTRAGTTKAAATNATTPARPPLAPEMPLPQRDLVAY
jgi:RNA recognition motif-containing protein